MKILLVYLSALIFPLACSNNEAVDEAASAVTLSAPLKAGESAVSDESAIVVTEAKIIKTSTLRFETDDINESYKSIQTAITKHKAIIQNDESGKDYASAYRNIVIRIPNSGFNAFIDEISQGVNHFDRKEISSQDVTEQYIDLEARMNAKKKLEKRYLELLAKANKVSEILEIEKELAVIREEIEAKEGQLKYLQSQISMSTITIEMYTNNASESGVTVSYGSKIWNAVKSGFNGLSSFILGIITIWPFILIFVVVFIFIRRRFKKKTN